MNDLEAEYQRWSVRLLDSTARLLPEGERLDIHVHVGIDSGTGEEMTVDAIERQLDMSGVEHAVLIPLNRSDGYRDASRELERIAADHDGRYRWLCRVDPARDSPADVEAAFDAGAAGLKLHPVSDDAYPEDPRLAPALELADERRAIVLVHAGIDADGASAQLWRVAARYGDAQFVIGHLAADSLAGTAKHLAELDNVRICTAWWGAADMAHSLRWSDPSRFVFGSDPPYGSVPLGLALTARTARAEGYDDDELAGVLGGNAIAALEGQPVAARRREEGPEVGGDRPHLIGRLPAAWQRCYVSMEVAAAMVEAGSDPGSQLTLAEAALEPTLIPPELEDAADFVRSSIDLARRLHADGDTRRAYIAAVGGQCMAATEPLLVDH